MLVKLFVPEPGEVKRVATVHAPMQVRVAPAANHFTPPGTTPLPVNVTFWVFRSCSWILSRIHHEASNIKPQTQYSQHIIGKDFMTRTEQTKSKMEAQVDHLVAKLQGISTASAPPITVHHMDLFSP